VIDTNGDGVITKPWNEPRRGGGASDPSLDTRLAGFAYGIIPNPADGSVWIARTQPVPGQLLRLELGNDPPETCKTEVYEPPFENDAVPADRWGFAPRGIDVARDGVIWTALSGSGHLASFDRSRCATLNGPTATGQHCPEGWTLYPSPGPQMKNVEGPGSADFHYYAWVDQFDTLGLGANTPIAAGTTSDALLALDADSGEWIVMRVPYPLGFYTRGMDGRVDDPNAGWKGRGVWADFGGQNNWHIEGGKGTKSKMVQFQIRPHPLAN
ncbi:MAG: carboxypeptidase regulatory-like domain-containing protein, partial [Myxococcota bacterium]|nr:carboxypeptidase regulatory-like domain-containing protein [Myxococcota bacterium]